jgi:hypothetical protein
LWFHSKELAEWIFWTCKGSLLVQFRIKSVLKQQMRNYFLRNREIFLMKTKSTVTCFTGKKKIKPVGSNKKSTWYQIITATNEILSGKRGDFREDLYHRINEFSIHSPSLTERNEDLMLFQIFFLEKSNQELNKNVLGFSLKWWLFFKIIDGLKS